MSEHERLWQQVDEKLWELFPATRELEGEAWASHLLAEATWTEATDEEALEKLLNEIIEDARETALMTQFEQGFCEASGLESQDLDNTITLMAHDWAHNLWNKENERWKSMSEDQAYSEGAERARSETSFKE